MRINLLKLLPLILGVQKRILSLIYGIKLEPESSYSYKSEKTKTYMTANMVLEINAKSKQKVQKVSEIARNILKKHIKDPDKILKFIESSGTYVIKANHIEKVLLLIGEDEGFIRPLKGFKALFLSIMINILSKTKIPVGFKTPAMFVMRDMPVNLFSFAHQFHHWLAFNQKLPGYEEKTMENFKNIWRLDTDPDMIKNLSLEDIISLRNAIARDVEAIDFVKAFAQEQIGAKNSLDKIKEGKKVNI